MFGIRLRDRPEIVFQQRLKDVFERREPIDALGSLADSINARPATQGLTATAIGIDTNILLKLASHPKMADVLDYLKLNHAAPTILPGQAIQEFFNNQYSAVKSLSGQTKDAFDNLKKIVDKIDDEFGDYSTKFEQLIDEFEKDFEYIYDSSTHRNLANLVDGMKEFAIVSFCPRSGLDVIANDRKLSKTPPGFKDDGFGDFYIWSDLLFGLDVALRRGASFDRVVFVTNDKKKDWSKDSIAHPILRSEMGTLFAVPFETWSVTSLVDGVLAELAQ